MIQPLFCHMNDAPDFSLSLKGASYEATLVLFPIASIPSSPQCDQVYFSTDAHASFEGVKNSSSQFSSLPKNFWKMNEKMRKID